METKPEPSKLSARSPRKEMKTTEANNKKMIWQDMQKKDKTFKGTWKDYENVRKPVEMKRNEKHVRTCMGNKMKRKENKKK